MIELNLCQLLIHLINNFTLSTVPELITKNTVLEAFKLSKYFIKQAQKVKVSAKETQSIQDIVSANKGKTPKETFSKILQSGEKINYTKIAEILGVDRKSLYNWAKNV